MKINCERSENVIIDVF